MKQPTIELTISEPLDAVWQALRDKKSLHNWHGWDAPGQSKEIDFIYFTDVREKTQADSTRRELTVNGGDTFQLEATRGGTKITLVRAPLSGNLKWDVYYNEITEGWISFLQQFKFMLECQPTAPRKTLMFSGKTVHGSLISKLGLEGVAKKPAGSIYKIALAGENAKGNIWFKTDNQLGITVDTWGNPGLLIIVDPLESYDSISARLILSTFQLNESKFSQLKKSWDNLRSSGNVSKTTKQSKL